MVCRTVVPILVVLVVAFASSVEATEPWTEGPYYGSRGTSFADVTGDEKADAIVVNDDKVVVRRSDGTKFQPNEGWTDGAYYGSRGTYFADVTGDGKADAIVVNDNGVVVRRSDGGQFQSNEVWAGPYYGSRGTFFTDVTGDGKADAIVVNDNGVVVRRSDGGQFQSNEVWAGPYYGSRGTFFTDVTGDGKADAIVVNDNGVVVRRSDGGKFQPNEVWTQEPYYGTRGTFFTDVTGDGKADAIVVNDDKVVVRRSDGTKFQPNEEWLEGPSYGSRATDFADVTGDKKADAIVVNDDKVVVRRSDGMRFQSNDVAINRANALPDQTQNRYRDGVIVGPAVDPIPNLSMILKRPFNIVAVGDSIMWGQGLSDQNKFVTLVAESLKKQLGKRDVEKHVVAHSGAITYPKVGQELEDHPPFPGVPEDRAGEVPHDYPSIHYQITQLAPTKVRPGEVDLVLVDGCINDIGVTTIINAFTSNPLSEEEKLRQQEQLRRDLRLLCGEGMQNILTEVVRTFPQAKVIVTGYYPIITAGDPAAGKFPGSDPSELVDWVRDRGIPIPPIVGELAMQKYLEWAAVKSKIFFEESERALRLAVDKMNALPPPLGGNRFRYTRPKFENYNAYAGGYSWLWRIPFPSVENRDEAFLSRDQACAAVYPQLSIDNTTDGLKCVIASTGHPNRLGAMAYANVITSAASFFLEEWLARFGLSRPPPEPEKVYKEDQTVCPAGLKCSPK